MCAETAVGRPPHQHQRRLSAARQPGTQLCRVTGGKTGTFSNGTLTHYGGITLQCGAVQFSGEATLLFKPFINTFIVRWTWRRLGKLMTRRKN